MFFFIICFYVSLPMKHKQESDASFTKEKDMKNQTECSPLSA